MCNAKIVVQQLVSFGPSLLTRIAELFFPLT
nr:MAG TPA: hypothetical protein [Caudoviricetes sp.]